VIFTTRSRTGLGIGGLVFGFLLADGSNHRLVPLVAGLAAMALGGFQIVSAYRHRDVTNEPDDPFASPPDATD
jgi:hypothetical protein